jgi:hypothetical protein
MIMGYFFMAAFIGGVCKNVCKNGDVYVLMLFYQVIQTRVPLRCFYPLILWYDSLCKI